MGPEIRFCETMAGERVAYVAVGQGPALVAPPAWVSNIQMSWDWPSYRAFWSALARRRTVVQYDRLGCGLSDRGRTDFTVEADVRALAAVVDHLELASFALMGVSGGGLAAIPYAARHPQRVTHLVLYGTGARTPPDELPLRAALRDLIRANWGVASDVLAARHNPGEDYAALQRHARFQREGASVEIALGLHALADRTDVTAEARRIQAPTVILHRRDDQAVPFARGRELAATISGARFVPLDGHLHHPQDGDSGAVLDAIGRFLRGEPVEARPTATWPGSTRRPAGLSAREAEALGLVAAGLSNKAITARLGVQVATVERHLVNLYRKLGVRSRTEAAAYAHRHDDTASPLRR